MSDTPAPTAFSALSPEETEKLQTAFKDIATRSQKLLQGFSERYKADGPQQADPLRRMKAARLGLLLTPRCVA